MRNQRAERKGWEAGGQSRDEEARLLSTSDGGCHSLTGEEELVTSVITAGARQIYLGKLAAIFGNCRKGPRRLD